MDIIKKYFPKLSDNQIDKLYGLYDIYADWNEKINLISRKDFNRNNFETRHILHSLSIFKLCNIKSRSKVLDVGTGGGFPGIVLAIAYPSVSFHLLDARKKKLMAVENITQQLKINNVSVIWSRIEDYHKKYDYITGRAVKDLNLFYTWTKKNLKQPYGKILYLTGGELDKNLINKASLLKVYELKEVFEEDYFETKKLIVFK